MTKKEQKRFVRGLSSNIVRAICEAITEDRVPTHWGGLELRQMLADKFKDAAYVKMTRKQKREYQNDLCILNL